MNAAPSPRMLDRDLDFAGRRVLVTGAAGGLGRAMAVAFASHGATLVLADIDQPGLARVAAELAGSAECIVYDQADPASIEALAARADPVDVLVNNAGIMLAKPLLDCSAAELKRVLDVDLLGVMLLAVAVARGMVARGSGVILNIGSQLAIGGAEKRGAYAAAKAAVSQFTRTAATEWGPAGVRVACLAPGRTVTPMNEAWLKSEGERGLARIPMGRYGTPDEAAKLALFLASPAAAYVHGATVIADGGFTLG